MRILKWLGAAIAILVAVLFGSIHYFKASAEARLARRYDLQVKPIAIPFPLSEAELAALAPDAGTNALDGGLPGVGPEQALEHAIARGARYMRSRAACSECHGEDLGGKVVIDAPPMGKWVAPNITRGGVTADYGSQDWVRLIRHGVKPDGTPATMPSLDYTWLSDQELSDLAAYIHSLPPVARRMPPSEMGPVYAMLIAQGTMPISAEVVDHDAPRPERPPDPNKVSAALGAHLATVCKGCHGPNLSGGPIQGGDPAWPDASNLTFHDSGLGGWSLQDLQRALREGVRPDGRTLDRAMPIGYTRNLSDTEVASLFAHLKELAPRAIGE